MSTLTKNSELTTSTTESKDNDMVIEINLKQGATVSSDPSPDDNDPSPDDNDPSPDDNDPSPDDNDLNPDDNDPDCRGNDSYSENSASNSKDCARDSKDNDSDSKENARDSKDSDPDFNDNDNDNDNDPDSKDKDSESVSKCASQETKNSDYIHSNADQKKEVEASSSDEHNYRKSKRFKPNDAEDTIINEDMKCDEENFDQAGMKETSGNDKDENDENEGPRDDKMMKLLHNRKAARDSRRRKKVMIEQLEKTVFFYTRSNAILKQQHEEFVKLLLHAQNFLLQNQQQNERLNSGSMLAPQPFAVASAFPSTGSSGNTTDQYLVQGSSLLAPNQTTQGIVQQQQQQQQRSYVNQQQVITSAKKMNPDLMNVAAQAMLERQVFHANAIRNAAQAVNPKGTHAQLMTAAGISGTEKNLTPSTNSPGSVNYMGALPKINNVNTNIIDRRGNDSGNNMLYQLQQSHQQQQQQQQQQTHPKQEQHLQQHQQQHLTQLQQHTQLQRTHEQKDEQHHQSVVSQPKLIQQDLLQSSQRNLLANGFPFHVPSPITSDSQMGAFYQGLMNNSQINSSQLNQSNNSLSLPYSAAINTSNALTLQQHAVGSGGAPVGQPGVSSHPILHGHSFAFTNPISAVKTANGITRIPLPMNSIHNSAGVSGGYAYTHPQLGGMTHQPGISYNTMNSNNLVTSEHNGNHVATGMRSRATHSS